MNNEFQNILTTLLDKYQKCEDANSVFEEAQLTTEDKELLENINSMLDAFDRKATSLHVAKEKGISRNMWIAENINTITEDRSEEEKTLLINEISKATSESIEKTLTQE